MDVDKLIDLYTDYLIVCPGQTTATGLSVLLDSSVSHDKFTRLLSSGLINSKSMWEQTKPMCHEIQSKDGVLVIDDSIEGKPYTDENELIGWHFDHTFGKSVKGVNFLTALYHSSGMSLPVGVSFVLKDKMEVNKKGKLSPKSSKTKNDLFIELVEQASHNVFFSYVLADSWFCTASNMRFISEKIKGSFIMAMKENRQVALTKEDKQAGRYVSIKSLGLEGRTMSVYVKQLGFPLLITKQVFKNGDGSTGALYLASNDLNLTYEQAFTIYKKRWKVEEYHKTAKSHTAFAKSPTHTVTTQTSHFVASIMSFVKLERLKIRRNQNHQAMKTQLLVSASKAAWEKLNELSTS